MDKHFASQSVTLPDKMMRLLLCGNRSLQRTSEWVEPTDDKPKGKMNGRSNGKSRGKINGKFNMSVDDKPEGKSAPTPQHLAASDTPLSITYLQLRSSHKRQSSIQEAIPATRESQNPDALPVCLKTSRTDSSATTTPEKPIFTVDKRAKKTFSVLFYTPSSHDTPGDTTWIDFVHAMLSIGFVAEKLYASVWHFTPPKSVSGESIQFHAPHAGDKIRYHMARLFGRRLHRAYGWSEEMFVVQ